MRSEPHCYHVIDVTGLSGGERSPRVLIPFDRRESITVEVAAERACRDVRTIRRWCVDWQIGRRIAGGPWSVSAIALAMLLNDDMNALRIYLSGDRRSDVVVGYYHAAGLGDLTRKWTARELIEA